MLFGFNLQYLLPFYFYTRRQFRQFKTKSQPGDGIRSILGRLCFQYTLILGDRMGLAKPLKQQMFSSNVTWEVARKLPVAVHVFGADLAPVWQTGNSMGWHDFQACRNHCQKKQPSTRPEESQILLILLHKWVLHPKWEWCCKCEVKFLVGLCKLFGKIVVPSWIKMDRPLKTTGLFAISPLYFNIREEFQGLVSACQIQMSAPAITFLWVSWTLRCRFWHIRSHFLS